jgi:hypothetical protein
MSDERLHELGIPRRRFLKGTAAAAFVSPLVVSFGLDGSAEATPGHVIANQACPNQGVTNQFATLDALLTEMILVALIALRACEIPASYAAELAQRTLDVAVSAANGAPLTPTGKQGTVCTDLRNLIVEIDNFPPSPAKRELLSLVHQAQYHSGCFGP